MPERLVPRRTATPLVLPEIGRAGEYRWDPVAVLDDRGSGVGNGWIRVEQVHGLGPEPLRRINAADVLGVIRATRVAGEVIQALGFGDRGVVLPKHEHGIR